jgi:hypothetical protein
MLDAEGLMQLIEAAEGHSLEENVLSVTDGLSRCCGPSSFADDVSLLALELPAQLDECV